MKCSHYFAPALLSLAVIASLTAATPPNQVPSGLMKSDWQSIRAAHEASTHVVTPLPEKPGEWQAFNPGQQWTTKFDGRGFMTSAKGAQWQWGLELRRYGFAGAANEIEGRPKVR